MPSAKTEATELLVGFGLLGIHPQNISFREIESYFQDTLSIRKFERLKSEYIKKPLFYQRLYEVGYILGNRFPPLKNASKVYWSGPQQQANTASVAKDLLVNQTPISVKVESNVVLNPSPYNLFVSIPQGSAVAQNAENWYLEVAYQEFQDLYKCVRKYYTKDLPNDIRDFERDASRTLRKDIQRTIASLENAEHEEFYDLYVRMCHVVADKSAELFNHNFAHAQSGRTRSSVLEIIARNFFRLDAIRYVLCGIDNGYNFAVDIPDLTSWKKNWNFVSINAIPDFSRKQSVVDFDVIYERKGRKIRYEAKFHSEIRWSHGKFCGNPEAKFYKEFLWKDIAFLSTII